MYDTKIIFKAYYLYKTHSSYRKVATLLQDTYKIDITRQTVANWINSLNANFYIKTC